VALPFRYRANAALTLTCGNENMIAFSCGALAVLRLALVAAAAAAGAVAQAQEFPTKPVTIVVPFRRAAPPTSWRARSARA
jgi:hypothetical protein